MVIFFIQLLIGFISPSNCVVLARILQLIDQFKTFTLTLVLKLSIVIRVVGVIGLVVNGTFKEVLFVEAIVDCLFSLCGGGCIIYRIITASEVF